MDTTISHLPLQDLGLKNIPAVPYVLTFKEPLATLLLLGLRELETTDAKNGLWNTFSIGGFNATGYQFLYGVAPPNPLTSAVEELRTLIADGVAALIQRILESKQGPSARAVTGSSQIPPLPLSQPEQFSISWTNFADVYQNALPQLSQWASSLTSTTVAAQQFWPTIANFGIGYNLLILEQVSAAQAAEFKPLFGSA